MTLKTISTGSVGNSYLLHDENECLILETGMPLMEVKKALDFNIRPIVGGVSSHGHGDHFKYHKEYERVGIKMFYPFLTDKRIAQFGGFKIKAFELPHGETKSYGFYITHPEIGKLLFLTDCEYSPVSFKDLKVNHILVECNYDTKYVDLDAPNFRHKVEGHMNLDTCREFVRHNASPELRSVILIHGSTATLNPSEAVQAIKDVVDFDVVVEYAVKGLKMELKQGVL